MAHPDQRFIEGIERGDNRVLNEIYQKHFAAVRSLVLNNSGTEDDARDIFQEALIVIHLKIKKSGKLELTSGFSTFLYAISRNLWLKVLRNKSGKEVTIAGEVEYTLENEMIDNLKQTERERLYLEKFSELGDDCQQVLKLFFKGERLKDIANSLGYASDMYARKKKMKCKDKLESLIKADPRFKELNDE